MTAGARALEWLRRRRAGRTAVVGVPYLWLLLFFAIPFAIVLKISFAEALRALPPYTPLWEWIDERTLAIRLSLGSFARLVGDPVYVQAYLNSVKVAAVSTVICLLIGYPMAYGIARASGAWRNFLLMLVILPFWTSFLLRVYAWIGLLQANGFINRGLMALGIIPDDEPLALLRTDFALYVGIVYSYLPFMVLPLYANLERMDLSLLEAAADLGCRPTRAFFSITLPLSVPGIVAGSMLVFVPAVGEFVIPALLGGPDQLMIGRLLWDVFFLEANWPVASAVAIAMLILLVVPIVIFQHYQARPTAEGR